MTAACVGTGPGTKARDSSATRRPTSCSRGTSTRTMARAAAACPCRNCALSAVAPSLQAARHANSAHRRRGTGGRQSSKPKGIKVRLQTGRAGSRRFASGAGAEPVGQQDPLVRWPHPRPEVVGMTRAVGASVGGADVGLGGAAVSVDDGAVLVAGVVAGLWARAGVSEGASATVVADGGAAVLVGGRIVDGLTVGLAMGTQAMSATSSRKGTCSRLNRCSFTDYARYQLSFGAVGSAIKFVSSHTAVVVPTHSGYPGTPRLLCKVHWLVLIRVGDAVARQSPSEARWAKAEL